MVSVYSEPTGHAISNEDPPLLSAADLDASLTVSKGYGSMRILVATKMRMAISISQNPGFDVYLHDNIS